MFIQYHNYTQLFKKGNWEIWAQLTCKSTVNFPLKNVSDEQQIVPFFLSILILILTVIPAKKWLAISKEAIASQRDGNLFEVSPIFSNGSFKIWFSFSCFFKTSRLNLFANLNCCYYEKGENYRFVEQTLKCKVKTLKFRVYSMQNRVWCSFFAIKKRKGFFSESS